VGGGRVEAERGGPKKSLGREGEKPMGRPGKNAVGGATNPPWQGKKNLGGDDVNTEKRASKGEPDLGGGGEGRVTAEKEEMVFLSWLKKKPWSGKSNMHVILLKRPWEWGWITPGGLKGKSGSQGEKGNAKNAES